MTSHLLSIWQRTYLLCRAREKPPRSPDGGMFAIIRSVLLLFLLLGLRGEVYAVGCPGGGTATQENLGRLLLSASYAGISCKYLGTPYDFSNLQAHAGIDYPAAAGTAVYAPMSGTLLKSGTFSYGDAVYFDLGNGKKLFVLHIKNFKTGWVNKGDKIAEIYQDHVHAELRIGYQGNQLIGGVSCGGTCTYSQIEAMTDDPSSVLPAVAAPAVTLQSPVSNATNVSPTSVTFSWTSQNATAHRLVISTTSNFSGFVDADGSSYCSSASTCWTTTTSSATSATQTLSPGVTYYWKVRASGAGGAVWSSSYRSFTTATAISKPSAPTNLAATASGTSITLRWTDASTNESGFRVKRWNGSAWVALYTTAAGATSYTDPGLASGTTYYYNVCSYNSTGESCPTNVSATTGTAGSVPGSVSVNPASGNWTSNQSLGVTSSGATSIYHTMANTYDGSTPYDPSSPSVSYNNGYLSGSSATFALYGSSGQLKKTKLRFVGCNSYGCGPVSGVYSYSIDQRTPTTTKPATPGSQSASAASSSSITVRWSDLSSNESGFRIYYRLSTATGSSSVATAGSGSTSYTVSGLSSKSTYYSLVCSYNSAGESCPTSYVQATTSSGTSGSAWDGVSPSGTACEADATTVASASNSYGKVELRWSNTCRTNWTRVVPNSSSYSTYGKIRRTSDGRSYTTSGTGTRFTAMVYAPSVTACASGTIKGYSISEVCR